MNNISSVRSFLREQNLQAILFSSQPMITYLTDYQGFSSLERDAYFLVTMTSAVLFTSPLYINEFHNSSFPFTIQEMSHNKPFFKELTTLLSKENISEVGIEASNLTASEYMQLKKECLKVKSVNVGHLRAVKTKSEIEKIEKACDIGDQAFSMLLSHVKPGMTEKEVAWILERWIKEKGAELSFPTIVAFGKNSAVPHHHTDGTRLGSNDIILLDFGVRIDSYCSDMTRTFFIGDVPEQQKKAYTATLSSQQKVVNFIKEQLASNHSVLASKVDNVSREYLIKNDYPSIPHSLGHGIGIEVHEAPALSPRSNDSLTEGMVFSIEPGIYLPHKFGIRIEDLYTIQNNNLLPLTRSSSELLTI